MVKKLKKDIYGFTQAGVGIGIGSAITAGVGAKAGVSLGGGLASVGGMMSPIGTVMMGGHALRMARKLKPKKRR